MEFLMFYARFPLKADFRYFRKYSLISHLQYSLVKYINSRSLPCLKVQKAYKSNASLVYLEYNLPSHQAHFKKKGDGETAQLKLQAVLTPQYRKLNTWFQRRVRFYS